MLYTNQIPLWLGTFQKGDGTEQGVMSFVALGDKGEVLKLV